MNALPPMTLMERQVDLVREALDHQAGMQAHLNAGVLPHLRAAERAASQDLAAFLDEETDITPDLARRIEMALAEVRRAISAGTTVERVPIPPGRLIGCSEAYDNRRVLSPAAESLQGALPPIEAFHQAVRGALHFAEAFRQSLRLLDID